MEIRGDDGKIINVENLLNNKTFHDGLMNELTKYIMEHWKEMESQGLIYNVER